MKNILIAGLAVVLCFPGIAELVPGDIILTEKARVHYRADDPGDDLRPGLAVSCKVRFDADPATAGEMAIVHKGGANDLGCYILRMDGPKEGLKFSFFVNIDGRPEPRVSVPVKPKVGTWYDVAAGWDGTNLWLQVDGVRQARPRTVKDPRPVYSNDSALQCGPMLGVVRDLRIDAPKLPIPADTSARPGFRFACDATFLKPTKGLTTILQKADEYWLRYDFEGERAGAFNLFINVNGSWEPRTSLTMPVEIGRTYRLVGGWNGLQKFLAVDGVEAEPAKHAGRCTPHPEKQVTFGDRKTVRVDNFCIRNEKKPLAKFGMFRTREFMPYVGEPVTLVGSLSNIGADVGTCTLTASSQNGARITPETISVNLGEGVDLPLEWKVEPGTNHFAHLVFKVEKEGRTFCQQMKRIVFMPKTDPDFSAKAWTPTVKPTRTYHVDAVAGDDSHDGLTPRTAWKTFRNAADLTLGPGERLLLKRGSVFNEELKVKGVSGSAGNWAEIGAYGEGMRPLIRRNRHLNNRCVFVGESSYLVVHDLIVCNAGAGLMVVCNGPESGHVLIERCLAHHIEGTYRFNSHGIPEWWDEPGPDGGARSCGFAVIGHRPKHVVMRDCESYQCSSGFSVNGTDTFVNRMFCHDNFAHNTSPHPYNCASRSWITDCVFDASGWHAAAGTMGIMLANNDGWVMRGCHFLNQPDSGSPDQGGIDFEAQGENCLVDRCTFRNNAGAAIEVLGLRSPQTRNVQIRNCKFDRNNWAFKNGPGEIQVWGSPNTPRDVACSNGRIEGNGYVLIPGVPFYINESPTTNEWTLANNREFDFSEDLDAAFPYVDPPSVKVCKEVWTDQLEAALSVQVDDASATISWEQIEGPSGVSFKKASSARTKAVFPGVGDYRVNVKADNGTLWRTAHTAVHVLPAGSRTFGAWDFSKNLDAQGWSVEEPGTEYQFIPGKIAFWNTESFPVRLVCGDYFVIAVKSSGTAAIVTPGDRDLGVDFSRSRVNAARIKMQNHTTAKQMRLWWQTDADPTWTEKNSVVFDVTPQDEDDSVYTVPVPQVGGIKQLKLSFSADASPITGTVRIDYIWLGKLKGE